MKTTYSLITPSILQWRKLCPSSLNAEKDLPDTSSAYCRADEIEDRCSGIREKLEK